MFSVEYALIVTILPVPETNSIGNYKLPKMKLRRGQLLTIEVLDKVNENYIFLAWKA